MRNILLAALLLVMISATAFAAVIAKPPELASHIKTEIPYGAATLRKIGFRVYDATLWTDLPTWSMQKKFALTLVYGINITGESLAERSITEINRTGKLDPAVEKSLLAELSALFPNVKSGDRITALYLPTKGTVFFHNGKKIGTLADGNSSKRFLGIWLSPETSEPQMRQKLLPIKNKEKKI